MKRFPHLARLYRNDKINMVKLSKEETEFYHYLQLTKFLAMRSLNLTLFLKNGIDTIDHMFFIEQESRLDGKLTCSFLYKSKDKVHSLIYSYSSKIKPKDNEIPTMKKELSVNIGKIVKILPWQGAVVFLLNEKGGLFLYNSLTKEITTLSYTGEFCKDVKFFSHSSIQATMMCHT